MRKIWYNIHLIAKLMNGAIKQFQFEEVKLDDVV